MSSEETKVAVMQSQINYIAKQVDAIVIKLDNNYTTSEEHDTLKLRVSDIEVILARLNWIIITAVLGALLGIVLTNT